MVLLASGLCKAQVPNLLNTLYLTPNTMFGFCEISDGVTDAQGNTYVVGSFHGTVEFDQTTLSSTTGGPQGFIAKLDATNNWTWAQRFGDPVNADGSHGFSVALDGIGGVYIAATLCGTNLSIGTAAISMPFPSGICVIKLNSSGSYAWTATSDVGSVLGCDIVADAIGNVFLAGVWNPSGAPVQFGPFIQAAPGNNIDAFLAKIDQGGAWVWVKHFTSSGPALEFLNRDLLLDTAGNIVLGGIVYGAGAAIDGNQLAAHPASDPFSTYIPFVAKWDQAGTLQWLSSIGNVHMGSFWLEALEFDVSGNIAVLGSPIDTVDFGPFQVLDPGGTSAIHTMARLDPNGNWTNVRSTSTSPSHVMDLLKLSTGEWLAMGTHNSTTFFSNDTLYCNGENDGFISVLDTSDQWLGGIGFGGVGWDFPKRLTIGPSLIRCVGSFEDVVVFGPDTLTCPPGLSCSFITTVDFSALGLSEEHHKVAGSIVVHPNPASASLVLTADASANTQVTIHDPSGRMVRSTPFTGANMVVDVAGLRSGSYLIRVGHLHSRFVKD